MKVVVVVVVEEEGKKKMTTTNKRMPEKELLQRRCRVFSYHFQVDGAQEDCLQVILEGEIREM